MNKMDPPFLFHWVLKIRLLSRIRKSLMQKFRLFPFCIDSLSRRSPKNFNAVSDFKIEPKHEVCRLQMADLKVKQAFELELVVCLFRSKVIYSRKQELVNFSTSGNMSWIHQQQFNTKSTGMVIFIWPWKFYSQFLF